MKIRDMLAADSPTVSFEFFPPKDEEGFKDLYSTIEALRPLEPDYVSVTYGAGGSTRRRTVELVQQIKNRIGIEAMAHLTCVAATRQEISGVLDELVTAGIENVLPLRGDPPRGESQFQPVKGGFRYASELVDFTRQGYDFCLGGACYPETHPEATSPESDLENLKKKVDAGSEFLITQLFFDNSFFFKFRDRARQAGICVPILAGIMPIRSFTQTRRFAEMCGATIPNELLEQLEAIQSDTAVVRRIGQEHAISQCEQLLREGVDGLHFYTLNRSSATQTIYENIRSLL